ncbi:bis(5'-nucleosyl)-tetraphosphatase [asymmetrical] [Schistocerca cancellata]|uniref:bis(5'-nucleosyl)-tetraphosphatase [asymmetrical] n=1 Tax=Schistocerca cancellata TaxID=274614 RepID=UPI0021191B8F|nr:bis(5'-nucleosyl)-tetraphosphatase [asymmetrical] [Schistocerca cancellata]XP_049784357.1 bis(5'-nucleosyl)-tetraphosphatase [asymmetrical] [Schistocerca cancellata]
MPRSVRAAGFVIFRYISSKIEYLLLQASYGEHHWTPPKGHVDPGESDITTAYRETEEEAGLKKDDLKIFEDFEKTLQYNVRGRPKEVVYWLAQLKNIDTPVQLSKEHQEYKWLELQAACELAKYPEMQKLLQECDSFLMSRSSL